MSPQKLDHESRYMMEQITVHVEVQNCRQETAPAYPNHFAARSAFSARV